MGAKKCCLFIVFAILACSFNNSYAKQKSNYKNFGIIISGPSGVGKTTIAEKLIQLHKNSLIQSISATTRSPRIGEQNGKHYYFIDREKFKILAKKSEFLEYAENYGNYYGTPRRNYIEAVESGMDIVLTLSADGMLKAKQNKNLDFVTIFIAPPSEKELQQRLVNRKTENKTQIKNRLQKTKKELSYADKYDYIVYNIDLETTVKQVEAIYLAEQRKREK